MGMFLNRGNVEFKNVLSSAIYVDKTGMIDIFNKNINTEQRYFCVSRPRRFGKSITANMLAAYFERGCDSRLLFEDKKLALTEGWDKNLNKYDTIRIDIADIIAQQNGSEEALGFIVSEIVKDLQQEFPDCEIESEDPPALALHKVNNKKGRSFIIIIDEWDCFFRDNKTDYDLQKKYIELLRSLFKGNRSKKFTALAYITGILPIKKYNSESALNNFYEYTMLSPAMLSQYVGFTEDEVKALCEEHNMDFDTARDWYDGYSFEGAEHIYGPNSVVRAMFSRQYDNYWSQTVAFSSLAGYINMDFDGLRESVTRMLGGQHESVNTFSYENDMTSYKSKDDVLTLLIHLGYLAYDRQEGKAYIPNKEVRQIFENTIKVSQGWDKVAAAIKASDRLLQATISGDSEMVADSMDRCHMDNTSILSFNDEDSLAACIMLSYYTARKDYEIVREMPAGYGFADLIFIPKKNTANPPMVIELKWNKSAQTAISQIKDKKYPKALEGLNEEILLVGINYDKESKKHECIIERT